MDAIDLNGHEDQGAFPGSDTDSGSLTKRECTSGDLDHPKSKYRIEETPRGCRIWAPERNLVEVSFLRTAISITHDIRTSKTTKTSHFGFCEYYRLSKEICDGLMAFWRPHTSWRGARKWAVQRTRLALGKRLHAQWRRLLACVEPQILAVHRAVFATTYGCAAPSLQEELYERRHRFVVEDVCQYRAAAVALRNLSSLQELQGHNRSADPHEPVNRFARMRRYRLFSRSPERELGDEPDVPIGAMHEWRALFSVTGETYGTLDRTLMNLPGGLPHSLVCQLATTELLRPIVDRPELAVLLLSRVKGRPNDAGHNSRVFHHTNRDQIRRALRAVADHTRNTLSLRGIGGLAFLVRFLLDYPEQHNGNIVGLARKSIRWHREQQDITRQKYLSQFGPQTKVATPPIALPDMEEVRFLATVEDFAEEGEAMDHCVASYIKHAIEGVGYFFHVHHEGEDATVLVAHDGDVLESLGPRNKLNGAAKWGRRILRRWSAGFSSPGQSNLLTEQAT